MIETFLIRDGARLRLLDTQAGGPPILFQHGLLGDARQVEEVLPVDHPARRITLECRGQGQSEAGDRKTLSIATFADDVAAAAADRGVRHAVVGGISMGAAIALRLAVVRPDLVRALILARPAWIIENGPENMGPNAVVGDLLANFSAEEARARFLTSETAAGLRDRAPDNLASLMGFFDRPDTPTTAALLTAISADGPGVTAAEVSAIGVPTLVIGHARDAVHPLSHAQALAGLIPGARLVEICPKATDKSRYVAEFRGALDTFLTSLPPRSPS